MRAAAGPRDVLVVAREEWRVTCVGSIGPKFQHPKSRICSSLQTEKCCETDCALQGSNRTARVLLMSPVVQISVSRVPGKPVIRHYSAWLLCSLLLLYCGNARAARYATGQHGLKLATTQSYLDSDVTRLGMSIAALLLLWSVAVIPVRSLAA